MLLDAPPSSGTIRSIPFGPSCQRTHPSERLNRRGAEDAEQKGREPEDGHTLLLRVFYTSAILLNR